MTTFFGLQRDKNSTSSALFGVAAILILVGAFGWLLHRERFGWLDWVVTLSGGLYLALGVAARWARLPAALIGLAVFLALLGYQASLSMELLQSGLIIKLPVALLLVVALVFSVITKQGRATEPQIPAKEKAAG